MNAPLGSSLGRFVASGISDEDAEQLRRRGWLFAEPQHFSLTTSDRRLTPQEFDWLQRIGKRLWGERGK